MEGTFPKSWIRDGFDRILRKLEMTPNGKMEIDQGGPEGSIAGEKDTAPLGPRTGLLVGQ